MTLPRCPRSDLPRVTCACCDSFTMTDAERAYLAGQGELRYTPPPAPAPVRVVSLPDYMGGGWVQPQNTKVVDSDNPCGVKGCTRAAGDAFVCPQCLDGLEVALGDVPSLLEDLLIMTTRQHRFRAPSVSKPGRGGTRWDGMLTPHESAHLINEGFTRAPYVSQAGDALRSLSGAVMRAYRAAGYTQLPTDPATASRRLLAALSHIARSTAGPDIAQTVTSEHAKAMRVIDRPDDAVYIGTCPECKNPMHAPSEDAETRCNRCGEVQNVADMQEELRRRLDEADMTLTQIERMSNDPKVFGQRLGLKRMQKWVAQGKLEKSGHAPHPQRPTLMVATYKLRDIRKVLTDLAKSLENTSQTG